MLGVREANANGLVHKKDIGVTVPRFFEECWIIGYIGNSTWSWISDTWSCYSEEIRISAPNSMKSPRDDEQPGPENGLSIRSRTA